MSLDDLRVQLDDLSAQERTLLERLQRVRAEQQRSVRELEQVEREQHETPLTRVRDAVVALGTFTISELAAELECSQPVAKRRLGELALAMPGLVKDAGRLGHSPLFAYVAPTEPGSAFTAQRKHAPAPPDVAAVAAAREHDIVQSNVSSISAKELRPVVRDAIARGWSLHHTGQGGHHLRLVKAGCKDVVLPSTPRNAGNAAKALRRKLRDREGVPA